MKIFISWSGSRSRAVAETLNDWLPRIIQAVKPFYSPEIEKGAKWSNEIDAALEGTRFGIICLTPDNIESTWIHYEAGALSKTNDALVWTFLHGLTPGDVPPPLGKFQHTVAEKDDILRLLKSINKRLGEVGSEPLENRLLEEGFELHWRQLDEKLRTAETLSDTDDLEKGNRGTEKPRDERAILEEILELVRSQERLLKVFEKPIQNKPGQTVRRPVSNKKLYREIGVYIPGIESDARPIAEKLSEGFSLLPISGRTIIESTPDVCRVRFLFDSPIGRRLAQEIIDSVSDTVGYKITSWEGAYADE